MSAPLPARVLEVSGLSTQIGVGDSTIRAVDSVDFFLDAGETLCLVGESGCGKSMTGLSIMGLLPPQARIVSGSIRMAGQELVGLAETELCSIRGNQLAMIFQDSISSLNPARTIEYQVAEPLRRHLGLTKRAARVRTEEMLALAGVPRPRERLSSYPHELSGGLRQRVMIAMALACEPKVLIADEPTTALDVTIQHQILELLAHLKTTLGMAVLLITHDMGVVARSADRVNVMYAGRLVESADTGALFSAARHPYTRGLLTSIPRLDHDRQRVLATIPGMPPELGAPVAGCPFTDRCSEATSICSEERPPTAGPDRHQYACWHPLDAGHHPVTEHLPTATRTRDVERPLLEIKSLAKQFRLRGRRLFARRPETIMAVANVTLSIAAGETLGLVGESGCGKTTLARTAVGLERPTFGDVLLEGQQIFALRRRQLRRRRREIQMMFQDPYSSLDPRMRVGAILREPLRLQGIGNHREQDALIAASLKEVGLPPNAVHRYPQEFSGGQRQRLGLARALILKPKLIVADEPVSALDVSVRSQVLNLMRQVQASHDLAYLLISHDLTVVKYLADRVGVMYMGQLVEIAESEDIYDRPAHPYTASLLSAIPIPDPEAERGKERLPIFGEVPSPLDPPSGCRFRTRCPRAQTRCAEDEPALQRIGPEQFAACHFPLREVEASRA